MVMDPTLPRIKVRDLLMQAFLTGWERSDKSTSQDEYLQSSIQVIEMLQVEPENLYAEEGLGLPDGEGKLLPDPVVPGRSRCQCKACSAGRTGRWQAVSGGSDPQAGKPLQGRKLRQFQPGAAPLLTF